MLQAERGATLRTAMLQAGVTPHNGRAALINCRGLGTCGTCAVEVQGPVEPQQWTAAERLRLHFPPHAPPGNQRLRLACQVGRACCAGAGSDAGGKQLQGSADIRPCMGATRTAVPRLAPRRWRAGGTCA